MFSNLCANVGLWFGVNVLRQTETLLLPMWHRLSRVYQNNERVILFRKHTSTDRTPKSPFGEPSYKKRKTGENCLPPQILQKLGVIDT